MPCDRCAALEARIEDLEYELGFLSEDHVTKIRLAFGITPSCAKVIGALYAAKGRVVDRWSLAARCGYEGDKPKIVEVYISYANRKIGERMVNNVWGRGFKISERGAALVAAALGE